MEPDRVGTRVVVTGYADTPLQALEEHLVLEPQRRPAPSDLEPDDVLVAVRSAAVGWVDLLMMAGLYQHRLEPPYTPGLEYAGEVAWVGDAVGQWSVGDAVLSDGFLTGPRSKGAHQADGGFATWAVAPARALRPLPAAFDFDQGASFLGSYETAFYCLVQRGRLKADETVLIHGATGSTGLAAVHVAKQVGATVIATSRSAAKLELVLAEGADHGIVLGEGGLREQVKELTSGRGVEVVYDPVGGDLSVDSLRCVAFGARYLVVGWAATPFVAQGEQPDPNLIPTNLILIKALDVLGCPTVIATAQDPSLRPPRTEALLRQVERGGLAPRVTGRYPISEVRAALEAKWRSRHVGAVVVRPAG